MPSNKIPTLIPGKLYEIISKPTFSSENPPKRLLPGYVTMIEDFVRNEDSNYVFIPKRITIDGSHLLNNDNNMSESRYNKAELSESFFVLEYEPTIGGKIKSQNDDK